MRVGEGNREGIGILRANIEARQAIENRGCVGVSPIFYMLIFVHICCTEPAS